MPARVAVTGSSPGRGVAPPRPDAGDSRRTAGPGREQGCRCRRDRHIPRWGHRAAGCRCRNTPGGYREGVRVTAVTGRAAPGVPRWLLLACTVLGLAAMHTLGHGLHGGPGHADRAGHHNQSTAAGMATAGSAAPAAAVVGSSALAAVSAAVAMSAAAVGCGVDGCGGPGRHELPVWSVCLAVLAVVGAVVLVAWLVAGRRTGGTTSAGVSDWCRPPRAPPRTGIGLRLSVVSVMRR